MRTLKLVSLLTILVVSNVGQSQITKEDVASWGLNIFASELNRQGQNSAAFAAQGLSKLFSQSSERKYQMDLAKVMNSLNIPDGIYAISGGNIAIVPDGYIKNEGRWFSLKDFDDKIVYISDGSLNEIPKEYAYVYGNGMSLRIPMHKSEYDEFKEEDILQKLPMLSSFNISEQRGNLINDLIVMKYKDLPDNIHQALTKNELVFVKDGWYKENGKWYDVEVLKNELHSYEEAANRNLYKYHSEEPYGIFIFSEWNDANNNGIKETNELVGLNKSFYNIAKEKFWIDLNIPLVSDEIVITSFRDNRLIGCTVKSLKKTGRTDGIMYTGPGSNPSNWMDCIDRIELDVKKNGLGNYKIVISNTDHEFESFEKTVKIGYVP